MRNRRYAAALAAALLILFPAGCRTEPAPPSDPSPASALPTDPPVEEPVFSPSETRGDLIGLKAAGEDRAALLVGLPEGGSRLTVTDTVSGAELARRDMPGHGDLPGVRPNGEILYADPGEGILWICSPDLTACRQVSLPEDCSGLTYSPGADCLSYEREGRLFLLSPEGELLNEAAPEEGALLCDRDPARGLAALERQDPDTGAREFLLWDYEADALLDRVTANPGSCSLYRGQLLLLCSRTAADPEDRIGQQTVLTLRGETPAAWEAGDYRFGADGDSPLLFGAAAPGEGDATACFLDPADGRLAAFDPGVSGVRGFLHCYLPGEDAWLAAAEYRGEDGIGRVRLIKASRQELSFDLSCPAAEPECGETLQALRQENRAALRRRADAIEKEFGVRILAGDDCLALHPENHLFSSVDGGTEDLSLQIQSALEEWRATLACYPKGFFDTFRSRDGDGGLRIAPVAGLKHTRLRAFTPGGLFHREEIWYDLLLDVTAGLTAPSLHHLLWHAVEERILDADPKMFYYPNWVGFNPFKYLYSYDFDNYAARSEQWHPYIFSLGEDPYFAREYSTVTDREDRATLVEMLFDRSLADTPREAAARIEAEYPHLHAKLAYMSAAVLKIFGTVYW